MCRILSSLLLLLLAALARAPAARAGGRTAAAILDDHAVALGDVASVHTLACVDARGVRTAWRLPRTCVRTLPTPRKDIAWREYFGDAGAFIEQGFLERFRPQQRTTRSGYYFLRALADPFPLRPYLEDPAAAARLETASATQGGRTFEVLVTPRDEHGVRAVFLLDSRTHLLENLRYEIEPNELFVSVTFSDYARVGGVVLPRSVYALFRAEAEDPATLAFETRRVTREERGRRYEVDPDLPGVDFDPPGLPDDAVADRLALDTFPTGPDPHEVAAGDLDGDGRVDLAVACEGGVWVHFGGAFAEPVRVPLGAGHQRGLVIEDLDLDGRPELVTTSNVEPAQTLFVVRFDAERNADVESIHGAPAFTTSIRATDVDRDGIPDLVFAARSEVQVQYGNGSGRARLRAVAWPLDQEGRGRRGLGLALGNLNGDTMTDVAVADGMQVVVFRGEPTASLRPSFAVPREPQPGSRPVAVALADVDGDGFDDLLVAREHPWLDLAEDVLLLRNVEDGSGGRKLVAGGAFDVGARVQSLATGHFDDDPHLDFAAPSFLTGEVVLLFGDGKGGFDAGRAERYRTDRGAARVVVADVDGDARDDVVVANRLGDSITVLRGDGPPRRRRAPDRAVACTDPTPADFALEGLTDGYVFEGEFRLPVEIADPSGLTCLGGVANAQLALVSDKRSAFFRATLDRSGRRLLVGPAVPLRGLEDERLDLEGIAFDRRSGTFFLACEADGSIVRATIYGDVLGRVASGLVGGGDDGLEGIALRHALDGTPLLYVFRERVGTTGRQPAFSVLEPTDAEGATFGLVPRIEEAKLPLFLVDQTGAAVAGERLLVVTRLARGIAEFAFDGDGVAKEGARHASFHRLTDGLLGLRSERLGLFGNVEGIAIDPRGDLFLLVDNNGDAVGRAGMNRGREGRLLWFRNTSTGARRTEPPRVRVQHLHVPFEGAERAGADVRLSREEAEEIARDVLARVKAGESLEALQRRPAGGHYGGSPFPREFEVVNEGVRATGGAYRRAALPVALARVAFRLDVGEAALAAWHSEECPYGWHVLRRVE